MWKYLIELPTQTESNQIWFNLILNSILSYIEDLL